MDFLSTFFFLASFKIFSFDGLFSVPIPLIIPYAAAPAKATLPIFVFPKSVLTLPKVILLDKKSEGLASGTALAFPTLPIAVALAKALAKLDFPLTLLKPANENLLLPRVRRLLPGTCIRLRRVPGRASGG